MPYASDTLLGAFLELSTSPTSSSWHVVECGEDALTYAELYQISAAIAEEISCNFGPDPPIVAVVSENHPFFLAVIIATWLLGGVIAPLDHHAPKELMERMLECIEPACAVLPISDVANAGVVEGMGIAVYGFDPEQCTIPRLRQRFTSQVKTPAKASWVARLGRRDEDAVFIFTSSAFSASTLKCVPLTHLSVFTNCTTQLSWLQSTFPNTTFDRLRILGWGPWTHIMGISHDLGAHCFLTGGCYIFGVVPSTYISQKSSTQKSNAEMGYSLLDTASHCGATAFAGVPWVLRKFMEVAKTLKVQGDTEEFLRIVRTLRNFKVMISGGAKTDIEVIEWAETMGLNFILGIGMTELGGPMFHTRQSSTSKKGWPLSASLIPDAKFVLMDDSNIECTENDKEGELWVQSKLIGRSYRRLNTRAFSTDSSGVITFRTGDIYSLEEDHLVWQGRREDYIQLLSGETLDPRIPESQLDSESSIARSCLVGDKWTEASRSICALIEFEPSQVPFISGDLIKALGSVNRGLTPPLRIAWSRVLVLEPGEKIPMTRKGVIWRKALEQHFGERLRMLLENPRLSRLNETSARWTTLDVESSVSDIVADVLGVTKALMEQHYQSTFAEFGMDSQMAIRIVGALNEHFKLQLPPNSCHDHIDLPQLSKAVCQKLGLITVPLSNQPHFVPSSEPAGPDVVIIGQALRLPGGVDTVDALWEALTTQREDLLGPVPVDRWDHASYYDPSSTGSPGTINFDRAGFIDVASYDNAFFGISSAEAYFVTPAARLALETSVEALENANVPLSSVKGTNMGVFVATAPDDGYHQLMWVDRGYNAYTRYHGSGIAASTVCGRLSYFLDIHGPSVSLDTACSAGMVALDNAVQYIKRGDGETAIVCSVNSHLWPGVFSFLSANQMASPRGRCATFSADADGYVPSEGVVSLILKSKSAAIRDKDNILTVIKATAVQHNGRSQGLIAPNAKAQASLQRNLLAKAHLRPHDIDLLETHGTGTILGDLIEIEAINDVFSGSHSEDLPLILGASKTVAGHTEASAGLVGLLATMMSLRTGLAPGLAHLRGDNLNANIDTTACPVIIPRSNILLPRRAVTDAPQLRGLNLAYGFAGTISGVVVEEYRAEPTPSVPAEEPAILTISQLFVLSAKTPNALMDYIRRYIDFCRSSREEDLASICYTSCVAREHYRYRFACVVKTMVELVDHLEVALSDFNNKAPHPTNPRPMLIFAYPGQGTQYQGMARGLCLHDARFDSLLRQRASEASRLLDIDILPFLLEDHPQERSELINETHIAQACIFVFQCAMTEWLQNAGIRAQGVLPHSLGEIAASVTAGVMTFRTGLEFIITRSMSMRPNPAKPGAMATSNASVQVILNTIQVSNLREHVTIAAFNSHNSHVISGDEWAVDEVSRILSPKARCKKLVVNQGFHSHCIASSLSPIRQWLESRTSALRSPAIPFYSSVQGNRLGVDETMGTDYWVNQAREPIRFMAAAENVTRDGATVVLDLGPQPILTALLSDIPACHSVTTVSLTTKSRGHPVEAFMAAIGSLFVHGVLPDFARLLVGRPEQCRRKLSLPTYPWQRQRFFPKTIPSKYSSSPMARTLVSTGWNVDEDLMALLADHSSASSPIVPTAAMALLTAQSVCGSYLPDVPEIDMRIVKPLVLDGTPGDQIVIEPTVTDSEYRISHCRSSTPPDVVCTGMIGRFRHPVQRKRNTSLPYSQPEHILSKTDIYNRLRGGRVTFGSRFQNLTEIRSWPQHADGIIEVEPTGKPRLDLIRQLDSCLHMFGALDVSNSHGTNNDLGSFLPQALNGFKIFAESLPGVFTCRYHFPVKMEKNYTRMTTSFEVLSPSGDLLASCDAYSVAWIPSNVPFVPEINWPIHPTSQAKPSLLRTVWEHAPRSDTGLVTRSAYRIVYVGHRTAFSEIMERKIGATGHSFLASDHLPSPCDLSDVVVYDATVSENGEFCDEEVMSYSSRAVEFMQAVSTGLRSRNIVSIIFLTQNAFILPEDQDDVPTLIPQRVSSQMLEIAGGMVQGMLRVLRNETGLQNVWGLDLPSMSQGEAATLLFDEIQELRRTCRSPIVYRYNDHGVLSRLSPSLRRDTVAEVQQPLMKLTGSVVVIGMGDIGNALAGQFSQAGCDRVIFISRRGEDNSEVLSALQQLRKTYLNSRFTYYSADVTCFSSLRDALNAASREEGFSPIQTVVHTASVIKDCLIPRLTISAFKEVISPKVLGSMNLHLACRELNLDIRRFIVLSSISVPLGNPGQIAYVAANSFLDTLASYRTLLSPSTRSVSLQLGAWQSRIIEGMRFDDGPMEPISHAEGIPLLLSAIEGKRTVQILSKLRPDRMQKMAVYAEDPYFQKFLDIEAALERSDSAIIGSRVEVEEFMSRTLKQLLEMDLHEHLDLYAPLASLGVDSIAFTQLRGTFLRKFSANIPLSFLGEEYMVMDIVDHIVS